MADIQLKCGKCGTALTVSEFADLNGLRCKTCGEPLRTDAAPPAAEAKPSLRLKTAGVQTEDPSAPPPDNWRFNEQIARTRHAPRRKLITPVTLSWVLFVLLGTAMWFVRYADILPTRELALLKEGGPYVFGIIHVMIVLRAFKDQIFQGILTLLIPFYSFFYLFVVSDYFFMRAAVAGLLVGIGVDSVIALQQLWNETVTAVNGWIARGGE